jgi:hypothetical protein
MTTNNVLAFTRPAPSKPKRSRPKTGKPGTPKRARRQRTHFGADHPLAVPARGRCRDLDHRTQSGSFYPVACGSCWEAAIRTDERVAVEDGLGNVDPVPADDLDEIALERALRGGRVNLTRHERHVAIFRLYAEGLTGNAIGKRLHIAQRDVTAVLDPFADEDEPAEDAPAALAA